MIKDFIKLQEILINFCSLKILSEACYLVYNYYYIKQGEVLTQNKVKKDIGKSEVTIRQYHEKLFNLGLLKFHNEKKDNKVIGYKVKCVLPSLEKIEEIKKEYLKDKVKIKNDRAEIKSVIDLVSEVLPKEYIPKKWSGMSIRMLLILNKKVDLKKYLIWVKNSKLKDANYNWFVEGRLSSNSMLNDYAEYLKKEGKHKSFKNTKQTNHSEDNLDKLFEGM